MPRPPESHAIESAILGRKRKIRVWSPDPTEFPPPYPLLLQQDGQLAFTDREEELPYGSWGVDAWIERLARDGAIRPPLVVGIDNSPARRKEYSPITTEFAAYQMMIMEELLPWIGAEFPVLAGPENRALMGSSMGGLVSFALAANNPGEFGAAACISPWFEHENNAYIHEVLRPMASRPPIRVYMDSGIRDWRGLDDGHRGMLLARMELLRLGFVEDADLVWKVDTWFPTDADLAGSLVKPDKWETARFNQHNEFQWNRRLGAPLRFLFGG